MSFGTEANRVMVTVTSYKILAGTQVSMVTLSVEITRPLHTEKISGDTNLSTNGSPWMPTNSGASNFFGGWGEGATWPFKILFQVFFKAQNSQEHILTQLKMSKAYKVSRPVYSKLLLIFNKLFSNQSVDP